MLKNRTFLCVLLIWCDTLQLMLKNRALNCHKFFIPSSIVFGVMLLFLSCTGNVPPDTEASAVNNPTTNVSPNTEASDVNNPTTNVPPDTETSDVNNPTTQVTPSVPNVCGDNLCDTGETCTGCPFDCGECNTPPTNVDPPSTCVVNQQCEALRGENCSTCAADCGPCESVPNTVGCGDGVCQSTENCNHCATDCGQCNQELGPCGLMFCREGTICSGCPSACECLAVLDDTLIDDTPPPSSRNPIALTCADGLCIPPENIENCPYDCAKSTTAVTVYLNFDGVTLNCTNRFYAPNNEVASDFCDVMIPDRGLDRKQTIEPVLPWDLSGYCPRTVPGSRVSCAEQIHEKVSEMLEPYSITVVTERPRRGPYTMIVVEKGLSPTNISSTTGPYVCGVALENAIGMIWAETAYEMRPSGCGFKAFDMLVRYMTRYILTTIGTPLNTNETNVMSANLSEEWCSSTLSSRLEDCGEKASDYYDDGCTEEDALNHVYCPDQYVKETLPGACSFPLALCNGEHPQCCEDQGTICSGLPNSNDPPPLCCRPPGAEFTFSELECCSRTATGIVCN